MLKLKPRSKDPKRPRVPSRPKDDHAPPTPLRAVPGLVRPRLHGAGAGCRGVHRGLARSRRVRRVSPLAASHVRGDDVDATDGTLARLVRIKKAVPSFDGRRLDDLIDFQTYTCLPLLLIWSAGLLPPGQEAWLLFPLAASAYGFCQVQAKTDDGYFLGFPSLWNVVAMYLYVLPLDPWLRSCPSSSWPC